MHPPFDISVTLNPLVIYGGQHCSNVLSPDFRIDCPRLVQVLRLHRHPVQSA